MNLILMTGNGEKDIKHVLAIDVIAFVLLFFFLSVIYYEQDEKFKTNLIYVEVYVGL